MKHGLKYYVFLGLKQKYSLNVSLDESNTWILKTNKKLCNAEIKRIETTFKQLSYFDLMALL